MLSDFQRFGAYNLLKETHDMVRAIVCLNAKPVAAKARGTLGYALTISPQVSLEVFPYEA